MQNFSEKKEVLVTEARWLGGPASTSSARRAALTFRAKNHLPAGLSAYGENGGTRNSEICVYNFSMIY